VPATCGGGGVLGPYEGLGQVKGMAAAGGSGSAGGAAAGGSLPGVWATAGATAWPALGVVVAHVFVAGLLAFGGMTVVLAQLEDTFVSAGHLTSDDFTQSYALASFAPGPSGPIFLALLAVQAFGLLAVPVVVAAWAIPSLTITHQLGLMSQTSANAAVMRLLSVLKAAAVGLIMAGVLALSRSFSWSIPGEAALQGVIAVVGLVLIVRFKVNPMWVLGGSMLVGALLLQH